MTEITTREEAEATLKSPEEHRAYMDEHYKDKLTAYRVHMWRQFEQHVAENIAQLREGQSIAFTLRYDMSPFAFGFGDSERLALWRASMDYFEARMAEYGYRGERFQDDPAGLNYARDETFESFTVTLARIDE